MQLIILIYNLTGASIKTSIANNVQILISAYLFLTGYGHFYYMWHRSDAGLTRYFQVIYIKFVHYNYKILIRQIDFPITFLYHSLVLCEFYTTGRRTDKGE